MSERLGYLDNLKILLVCGVIALHVSITYGFDGSWYLESYDEMSGVAVGALTLLLGIGWLFGLGLFFLIAGRLSGPSLDHKGAARFARDRAIRLGIPLAAYTLLVSPILEYVAYRENDHGTVAMWPFVREQVWHFAPGPAWFLEALLVFSVGYALLRALRRGHRPLVGEPLTGRLVAVIAVAIACGSFAAHLAFPIGSEQFHLQLGMFPQYVVMFALGAAAGRRGWMETLTPSLRKRCGLTGLATAVALPVTMIAGDFFESDARADLFAGGWHWQASAASLAEGVIAVCISLWAVGVFESRLNRLSPITRRMAPSAYGAFVLHPPVIVGLALAVQPLDVPAEFKFVAVLCLGISASFAITALASRSAMVGRVIGSEPRPT